MNVSELSAAALLGISAALSPGRTAAADAPASRPVPPMDAEAPKATQAATFATG